MKHSYVITYILSIILHLHVVLSKKPNIVLILADDYGYNDIGYHGSEIKTPTLDQLASEGVKLENYYVQPICTPTRSQLLSGRYQIHTGLQHSNISPGQRHCLPLTLPTIADKLKEQGYSNHIVGKWHVGFYRKECTPTYRGFDTYLGYLTGSEDYHTRMHGDGFDFHTAHKNSSRVDWEDKGPYSAHLFSSRAQDIITHHAKALSDKPLFLYMPFQSVHAPLEVPQHYEDKYKHIKNIQRRKYAGMVTALDEAVRNLTDTLKSSGLWDNTVLFFSTDNGGQVHSGGNNWPLRGWKHSLWEGGMRGVGFVTGPLLQKQKGKVTHELMHVTDWFPTMLHLGGGSSEGLKLDGYNQWDTLSIDKPSPRQEILHNIDPLYKLSGTKLFPNTFDTRIRAAVRSGDWKLITGDPGNGSWVPPPSSENLYFSSNNEQHTFSSATKNLWLFNIKADPNERNDLSSTRMDVVKLLLERLVYYNSTAVPVVYPKHDPKANPKHHGGAWIPWVK